MEDPASWRVYASRNEVMKTGFPYVCKHVVFGHFKHYLDSLRGQKTPREIANHIAEYMLQNEYYQSSKITGYYLKNLFKICDGGHRVTNISDYSLLVRRIRELNLDTRVDNEFQYEKQWVYICQKSVQY